jgi:hypothetical protein
MFVPFRTTICGIDVATAPSQHENLNALCTFLSVSIRAR